VGFLSGRRVVIGIFIFGFGERRGAERVFRFVVRFSESGGACGPVEGLMEDFR